MQKQQHTALPTPPPPQRQTPRSTRILFIYVFIYLFIYLFTYLFINITIYCRVVHFGVEQGGSWQF